MSRVIDCDALAAPRYESSSVSMPAQVLDISRSGIRLALTVRLAVLSEVTLRFDRFVVAGQVRYCRKGSGEFFDVGLQLEDVLNVV